MNMEYVRLGRWLADQSTGLYSYQNDECYSLFCQP